MKAALVMFKADGSRREFALPAGATVVGRKNSCGLRIPLTSVSRQHCEFRVEGAGVTLRDLGSSNGTYRNGERVQEAGLSAGDTVVVGPVQFTLTVDGQPPDIKPARPALESVGAGAAGAVGGAAVAALPPSMDVADAASSQADMSLSDDLELDIPDAAPALGDEDQAGGSGGGAWSWRAATMKTTSWPRRWRRWGMIPTAAVASRSTSTMTMMKTTTCRPSSSSAPMTTEAIALPWRAVFERWSRAWF